MRGDRHIRKRLVDWLEKLGLGQHAQRFAENDISFVGIRLNHGVRGRQVVRFHFIFSAVIAFVAATMLTKCGNSSVVWEHYDQCALENPSFLAMAECGRRKRLAACEPNNTCSPEGTMFMQYVDSLVLLVKKKELTEAEAMRRYTQYKSGGTPLHP